MLTKLRFLAVLLLVSFVASAQPTGHPRLFFGAADTAAISARTRVPGSAASQLFAEVLESASHYTNLGYMWHSPWHHKSIFYDNLHAIAFAYLVTHQQSYANRAKDLVFRTDPLFNQQGIIWDQYPDGGAGLRSKVIALSIVYDLLFEQLSQSERKAIQDTIIQNLAYPGGEGIRDYFLRPDVDLNRHEFRPAPALLLGAMSIYGDNPNYPTALANSDIATAIHYTFTRDVSFVNRIWSPEQGDHADGVSYSLWGISSQLTMLEAWSRWDGVNHFQDQNIRDRFSKACDWYAYEVLPQPQSWPCMLNTINDSYSWHYGAMGQWLHLSTKYPEKAGLMRWIFDNTIHSISSLMWNPEDEDKQQYIHGNSMFFILPIIAGYTHVAPAEPSTVLPSSKYFRWSGLVQIRTSQTWGSADDIQFAFTSLPIIHPFFGRYSHHHDQADKNHFTLSAYGDLYLRDYGYDNGYSDAHNVVLIDGKGQPFMAGSGLTTHGRIVEHAKSDLFDFIHGDATLAHNQMYWFMGGTPVIYTPQNPGPVPPDRWNTVERAHRYVTFSRASEGIPPYFVVADDIQAETGTHIYSWRFQSAKQRIGTNPMRLEGTSGNYLDMFFTAASGLSSSNPILISPTLNPGDNEYMGPFSNATICDGPYPTDLSTTLSVANPFFHVVLMPHKANNLQPSYSATSITNGSIVQLQWPNNYSDYSVFKYQGGSFADGQGFVTDAKLTRMRKNTSSGQVISFLSAEGSSLSYSGVELVNLYGFQGTVMKNETAVSIVGNVSFFKVYAPSATQVKLNDTPIPFVQNGDYVESTTLQGNHTWSGNVTVFGDVTVSNGATLSVAAGTTVRFIQGTQLLIDGSLAVQGTSQTPVTFTTVNQGEQWSGITSGLVPSTITLNYCNISNASTAINVGSWTTLTVSHCNFSFSDIGINIFSAPWAPNPTMQITNNTFTETPNNGFGISIDSYSDILLAGNSLTGPLYYGRIKGTGIYLNASSPRMIGNTIQ